MFVLVDESGYVSTAMEREVVTFDGSVLVQDVTGMTEVAYSGDIADIHDYRLINGSLVYDDTRKREEEQKREALAQKQSEQEKVLSTLAEAFNEEFVPSDKQGQLFRVVKIGEVEIMREYVPDPNYDPDAQDGTYTKPFTFTDPMEVVEGKFYTDGEDIWECIKSGLCETWADPEFFDVIAV